MGCRKDMGIGLVSLAGRSFSFMEEASFVRKLSCENTFQMYK